MSKIGYVCCNEYDARMQYKESFGCEPVSVTVERNSFTGATVVYIDLPEASDGDIIGECNQRKAA